MDKKLEPIVQALQEKFNTSLEEYRDEVHMFISREQIVEALTLLRDKYDFELLSAMTASDYWPQLSPRFHVIYQLTSLAKNLSVQLRVPVDDADDLRIRKVIRCAKTSHLAMKKYSLRSILMISICVNITQRNKYGSTGRS